MTEKKQDDESGDGKGKVNRTHYEELFTELALMRKNEITNHMLQNTLQLKSERSKSN